MYNLLKANFYRLRKDIIFWLFLIVTIGIELLALFRIASSGYGTNLYNFINEYGANALFYAIARGNNEIAKLLLERGADANIVASYGPYGNITPLALASTLGLTDIISSLLIGKSSINFKMRDGRTALIWAAISGKSEAVNTLINSRADLNIADNDGKTALMFAAENGDYFSVEYLINAGAHLNTLDKFKKTALMYAMENGNTEVVDLLTRASLTYGKQNALR